MSSKKDTSSTTTTPSSSSSSSSAAAVTNVDERRKKFKSVFDAMEEYDFRQALRLLERKDIASLPLAKALRGKCLLQLGARSDAVTYASEALKTGTTITTDPEVIATACSVFKANGEDNLVVQAYETAITADPTSVPLNRGLIFSLLRLEDYKRMQTVCLRLYKQTEDPTYMYWAAFVINVSTNDTTKVNGPAPNVGTGGGRGIGASRVTEPATVGALGLGEALLTRTFDNEKNKPGDRTSEALGLFLHMLVRANKPADAYAALVGKYAYLAPANSTSPASDASSPAPTSTTDKEGTNDATKDNSKDDKGKSPGPFQLVDQLRYAAYTLTYAATLRTQQVAGLGGKASGMVIVPSSSAHVPINPTDDHPVGSWEAVQAAYAHLLLDSLSDQHEDWATWTGLGYATAYRLGEQIVQAISSNDLTLFTSLLVPITSTVLQSSSTSSGLYGISAIDTYLRKTDGKVTVERRSSSLAVILLQAVRLEFIKRLLASSSLPSTFRTSLTTLEKDHANAFTGLITAYIRVIGDKACCFSDLKIFLPTLLPEVPPQVSSSPSSSTDSPNLTLLSLTKFLATEPTILSMPFAPVSAVGQASDVSPSSPLFTWSFSIPTATVNEHYVAPLRALSQSTKPDETLRNQISQAIDNGRAAAIASGSINPDGSSVVVSRKQKKGSAAVTEESNEKSSSSSSASDPHDVNGALASAAELKLSDADTTVITNARNRIRMYTSTLQFLRFTNSLGRGSSAAYSFPPSQEYVQGIRTTVTDIMQAWEYTLPLAGANVGGSREGLEGDDLPLIACHLLWEVAFTYLLGYEASLSTAASSSGTVDYESFYSSRNYFIESLLILHCASVTSEHNPQIRLALVKVYTWLGSPAGSLTAYRKLRIKHITVDTLIHNALPHVTRITWPEAIKSLCDEICTFHRSNGVDNAEYTNSALIEGNLSSAVDILRMKTRLNDSAMLMAAKSFYSYWGLLNTSRTLPEVTNHLRRSVLTGEIPDIFVDVNPVTLRKLRDNDDRDIASSWNTLYGTSLTEQRDPSVPLFTQLAHPTEGYNHLTNLPSSLIDTLGHDNSRILASLATWNTGSNGGTTERLVRKVVRETMITLRHAIMTLLVRSLDKNVTDATTSLTKVKSILTKAGYGTVVEGGSSSSATANASQLLYGDVMSNTIPFLDAGVSAERIPVRNACIRILYNALSATVMATEGNDQSWLSTNGLGTATKLTTLLTETSSLIHETVDTIIKGRYLPPSTQSSIKGFSENGGALAPFFLPEFSLLVTHILPYVCISILHIGRMLSGAEKPVVSKSSKGKTATASSSSSSTAPTPEQVTVITSTQSAAQSFTSQLVTSLQFFLTGTKDTKSLIEGTLEKAMTLVTAGFDQKQCSTTFITNITVDFKSENESSKKGTKTSANTTTTTNETMVSYSNELAKKVQEQFKTAIQDGLQGVGASYTNGLTKCREDVNERLAFLKGFKI